MKKKPISPVEAFTLASDAEIGYRGPAEWVYVLASRNTYGAHQKLVLSAAKAAKEGRWENLGVYVTAQMDYRNDPSGPEYRPANRMNEWPSTVIELLSGQPKPKEALRKLLDQVRPDQRRPAVELLLQTASEAVYIWGRKDEEKQRKRSVMRPVLESALKALGGKPKPAPKPAPRNEVVLPFPFKD